ncbi:hypothetical protein D3C80_1132490 [compost metagenome]
MTAAAGETTTDWLSSGIVASGIKAGNRCCAVEPGQPQSTGAAHCAFQPKLDLKELGEGINAATIERHEEIGLGTSQDRLHLVGFGKIEPGIDGLRKQGAGDDRATLGGARAFYQAVVLVIKLRETVEGCFCD